MGLLFLHRRLPVGDDLLDLTTEAARGELASFERAGGVHHFGEFF